MFSMLFSILPSCFGRNVEIFGIVGILEVMFVDWWLILILITK